MVKEDPVTYVVVLPYFLEDEAVLRETLENLGRSSPAEKHMRVVLATDARKGPHSHDKAECLIAATGHLVKTVHPTSLGPSDCFGRNTVWSFASSVFKTVGDAGTPWPPQFVRTVTFEILR